ncbi:hypothetical protein FQN49_008668, partial [Arthroderma sp. PD_2]
MGHEIDDFLSERLEPVVISGGGIDGSILTRTQSGQSESSMSVLSITGSKTAPQTTLVQSPEPLNSPPQRSLLDPGNSQSQPSEVKRRRSFRNSKLFGGQKTSGHYLSVAEPQTSKSRRPSDASTDSRSEASYQDTPNPSASSESNTKSEIKKKKSEKSGRWNFFQRSHPNVRGEKKQKEDAEPAPGMPAAISQIPSSRAVAHYAILDNEQIDSDPLEDIMTRVEESPPTEEEIESANGLGLRSKHGQSILLPEPPVLINNSSERRPSSPKVFFNTDMLPPATSDSKKSARAGRPSRLASVGRIPPVVSSSKNQHKPSLQSFSRPFSVGEGPSLTVTAAPGVSTHTGMTENPPNRFGLCPPTREEFLSFSPRKGSEVSVSSDSADGGSLAAVTAVLPFPGSKLTDDEIWQEYDDFLDKVTSPQTPEDGLLHTPRSFNLATRASKVLQEGLSGIKDISPQISPLNPDIATPELPDHSSIHLSRSMILSALHSSIAPSEPMSLGELLSAYAGSKQNSTDLTGVDNPYASLGDEMQYDANKTKNMQKEKVLQPIEEDQDHDDPMEQANVRSGSLMTSRWLSFGRVLFSPAKNHMQPQDQARILVIDGLGNDDWSFYCALTYPSAVVYNLTSNTQPQSAPSNPAAWDPPANHRTIHRSGIKTPFPFPKGFFTVAVMRFPAACSETAYDTVIS